MNNLKSAKKRLAGSQQTPLKTSTNIVGRTLEKENVSPSHIKLSSPLLLSPERFVGKLTFGMNEYDAIERETDKETERESEPGTGLANQLGQNDQPMSLNTSIMSDSVSTDRGGGWSATTDRESPDSSFSLPLNDKSYLYLDDHNKVPVLERSLKVWQLKANLLTQEVMSMREKMEIQFREKDQQIRAANDAKDR
jgi:hypothetical protein